MRTFFDTYQGEFESLGVVALAMLLGALLGLDREWEHKPAGLRTHMLVAGGSAWFVILGTLLIEHYAQQVGAVQLSADPTRVLLAVVTGVSFLGAGTIIRDRTGSRVEGLTTASSLLLSAAIGVGVALRQYVLAVGGALLVLITLRGVGAIEHALDRRYERRHPPPADG